MSAPIRVVLNTPADEGAAAAIAAVLAQLPELASVPPGTQVVVVGRVASRTGLFARIFGGKKTIPRTVRSSALLARGFVDIAAASEGDDDLVWGFSPPS